MKFFSLLGLGAVALSLIPNVFFARKKHVGKVDDIDTCGAGICLLEVLSKWVLSLSLIFARMPHLSACFGVVAVAFLIINYCLWISYFKDGCYYPDIYLKKLFKLPIPFTLSNVLYFVFISLWLGNFVALFMSVVYGICYILNSLIAMKDLSCRVYE